MNVITFYTFRSRGLPQREETSSHNCWILFGMNDSLNHSVFLASSLGLILIVSPLPYRFVVTTQSVSFSRISSWLASCLSSSNSHRSLSQCWQKWAAHLSYHKDTPVSVSLLSLRRIRRDLCGPVLGVSLSCAHELENSIVWTQGNV